MSMQSGPGFQVGQQVPTNGAMGQYTIVATRMCLVETRALTTSKVSTC